MECDVFENRLQEWLDGDLPPAETRALWRHAEGCPDCAALAEGYQTLGRALKDLPVAEPGPARTDRLLKRRRRLPGPVTGIAAAGLLAALLLPLAQWQWPQNAGPRAPQHASEVEMPLHQTRTIQLALSSPRTLKDATVVLELPPGVSLRDHPERRSLRWQTDIVAGENRLSLPLIAHDANGHELIARIEHREKSQEFRLRLNVRASGAVGPSRGAHEVLPRAFNA